MKELSSKRFRAWLEARSPYGSVGRARDWERCPLATYLGPGWCVSLSGAEYREPGAGPNMPGPATSRVPLPRWAERFVDAVDELPKGLSAHRQVWPRTALQLLDEAVAADRKERARGGP